MLEQLTELLIPITAIVFLFGGGFGIVYFHLKTRNQQRLAMLDKGLDRDVFAKGAARHRLRRWGLALLGVGAGVLVGHLLDRVMDAWVAYSAGIALSLGGALMIAFKTEAGSEGG